MEFKLARHLISEKLEVIGSKKIRENKLPVPRASKKTLTELVPILKEIETKGLPDYLVLKKLEKKLGFGIFLHPEAKPIPKGSVIGPYTGIVSLCPQNGEDTSDYIFSLISDIRLTKEEQKIWDPNNQFHPRRLYSIDLDAKKEGNFTRFINHSHKPNIEAIFVRIPENNLGLRKSPFELIYIAKKTIKPGEQLLVCYDGDDNSYWGALKIKPFPMTPQTFKIFSPKKTDDAE